jgi:UbiD family decarboxylase
MAFRDLREFLDAAVKHLGEGEVKQIDGADWNGEIGCITELMAERNGPILLFDNIVGYPKGFRVVSNFVATAERTALALGLPTGAPKIDILRAWKDRTKLVKPIPPQEVRSGPVTRNVMEDEALNLEAFPAPKWHAQDGGRYIGTGHMVVTRDPDSGWVNLGTYRACIQGRNRLSLWMIEDRHARQMAMKYWERGQSCPVAIVLGCEPATWMASPTKLQPGVSEYDYAGALRGAPVEVVAGPLTGLPVPADAEIVLEGWMPPPAEETAQEGPFGEWPGYYTHSGLEPVVRVERVMYRDDPIILGAPPLLPTTPYFGLPLHAARIWEHLENSGVPDIRGVWIFVTGLIVVISIRQRYAGHSQQALIAASGLRAWAMDRYFVVVDDDIDASDLNQVLWAICTRVDPSESVQILKAWTTDIDPRLPPEKRAKKDLTMGRMLIDACKPFTWKDEYPVTNRFDAETRARVFEKWRPKLEG